MAGEIVFAVILMVTPSSLVRKDCKGIWRIPAAKNGG